MAPRWFKRLADVPDVGYPGSPGIDRRTLLGHDDQPKLEVWSDLDGRQHEWLNWPLRGVPDGSTSASPASEHARELEDDASAEGILRNLYEALELPGTLSDYHFA